MPLADKLLLRKRALIETIIDQLKNVCETLALTPPQSLQLPRPPAGGPRRLLSPTQEALARLEYSSPHYGLTYPELRFIGVAADDGIGDLSITTLREATAGTGARSATPRIRRASSRAAAPACRRCRTSSPHRKSPLRGRRQAPGAEYAPSLR
jgi:hypothetical protein